MIVANLKEDLNIHLVLAKINQRAKSFRSKTFSRKLYCFKNKNDLTMCTLDNINYKVKKHKLWNI